MDKITLVGNYVDILDISKLNDGGCGHLMTFIGKMDYEPNVLAVEYFCKEILPDIMKQIPDVKFCIVGARPDKRVLSLNTLQNVEVTGFVESVEPFLKDSAIIVAPMLTGSGIQNKIIQAMAYGCCVVTTAIGAEGLSQHESGLSICNNREDWINTLVRCLNDREFRIKKGKESRKYIESTMSKDIVRKQFLSFINRINN